MLRRKKQNQQALSNIYKNQIEKKKVRDINTKLTDLDLTYMKSKQKCENDQKVIN